MTEIELTACKLAGEPPVSVAAEMVTALAEGAASRSEAVSQFEATLNEQQRAEFSKLVHSGWSPKGLAKRYGLSDDFTRMEYEAARASRAA